MKCSSYFYNHVDIKIRIATLLRASWELGAGRQICCFVVAVIFCYVTNKVGGSWPAGKPKKKKRIKRKNKYIHIYVQPVQDTGRWAMTGRGHGRG